MVIDYVLTKIGYAMLVIMISLAPFIMGFVLGRITKEEKKSE